MTRDDFNSQMLRLIATFGKNAFPEERAVLIYREVQSLPVEPFAQIVDRFIGEFRQAPLIQDFREEISKRHERLHVAEASAPNEWDPNRVVCEQCNGVGVYLCHSRLRSGLWAFRCYCPRGESDPRRRIPQFKQAHLAEFYYAEIKPTGMR